MKNNAAIVKTTSNNAVTLTQVQLQQVIEQLKQDNSTLLQAYSEYASNNGYDSVYDNDELILDDMFTSHYDAIRSAFYGDYNPSHAYFTFNGYGNLQSFEYLISDNSPIDIEELAQWIIDNDSYSDYDIEVTTLGDMLASIEDNITDDENLMFKLADFILIPDNLVSENEAIDKGYNDYNEWMVEHIKSLICDYDYNQLNDIILMLGINYN